MPVGYRLFVLINQQSYTYFWLIGVLIFLFYTDQKNADWIPINLKTIETAVENNFYNKENGKPD